MATLQKIRNRGKILIATVGLALFAFIAEEFVRSLTYTQTESRQRVGEIYGEKINVQEFNALVEEYTDVVKFTQGVNTLSEDQLSMFRDQVWQSLVNEKVMQHECEKLGITVTDAEMQDIINNGRNPMLAQTPFRTAQGTFDVNALKQFLNQYNEVMNNVELSSEVKEQYQQMNNYWKFIEKTIRQQTLNQKYQTLLNGLMVSNPTSAQASFDGRTNETDIYMAALPFTSIKDDDVKVEDSEIKAKYEEMKELFRSEEETRDIKYIDIHVTASDADKAALMKEVQNWQQQLQEGVDPANVVGGSKTSFAYSTLPMSKKAFQSIPDVAAGLDSMAVGAVKPAYYNAQDNTITTYKLVSKVQAADSVLYRRIVAVAETPEKSAARADSIMKAIEGGKTFAAMAKELNQPTDSVWSFSSQYEQPGLPADEASVIAQLNTMEPGVKVLSTSQGSIVFQVLERRNIEAKYNVAVVKCPLNFSKATYNTALNKLNKFRASNTTFAAFEKNAAKAGYTLLDFPASADNLALQTNIGGSAAKDAMKWVFDDAKAGEVSKIYECGRENNHLLVLGVKSITTDEYMPLDNDDVKKVITSMVQQQKKAEKLLAQLKGVKDINAAKAQKGAVAEELKEQTFYSTTMLQAIGVPEPKLAGAIARTQQGKFSGAVQGAAAIYFVQVQSKTAGTEKYDEKIALEQASSALAQNVMRTIIPALAKDAKVRDQRYKF